MSRGYTEPLYILAFDHRGSFAKGLFGIETIPNPQETQKVADSKLVIYEAFQFALNEGIDPLAAGLLVDEQFGEEIARSAAKNGHLLAMPVERSGQAEFDFEFDDDFGEHIERFQPDFVKVLVRYNPDGDAALNDRQANRLARLSAWLERREQRFLFELLVPAEREQLAAVGGDVARYDLELRPELVTRTLAQLQGSGVEPDIWKIEGLDRREDCLRVAEQARSEGRDEVACIVLGRGANEAKVFDWLRAGAGVDGYVGFAVGRTLWWNELVAYIGGRCERSAAVESIAANFERMVEAYQVAEESSV